MLTAEQVRAAYTTILLREPEPERLDHWIKSGLNFKQLRDGLLACEEFAIIQQASRQRSIKREADTKSVRAKARRSFIIDEVAVKSESNNAPLQLVRALNAYRPDLAPHTILVLGGQVEESIAACVAMQFPNRPITIFSTSRDGGQENSIVRLPMTTEAIFMLMDQLGICIDLVVAGHRLDEQEIRIAYSNIPETGILVINNERSFIEQNLLELLTSTVWGEAVGIANYTIASREVWPFEVQTPDSGQQSIHRGSQKIALAAIMKNEEDTLPIMLSSCSNIIDYVVLIDTGSTDKSVEISKQTLSELNIPFIIEQIAFIDFAQARNSVLSLVPKSIDWVLMLDCDEYIELDDAQGLVDLAESNLADTYYLPRYNYLSADRKRIGRYPDRQARFFRFNTNPQPYYINPIHESLVGFGRANFPPLNTKSIGIDRVGPHIHHTGELRGDEKRMAKNKLYQCLADSMV